MKIWFIGYRNALLILCALLLAPVLFFAQPQRVHYEHLWVKNGLSSNKVTGTIQDQRGFYWISSNDGLNRFDGSRVKIFRHSTSDTSSIAHNNCSNLLLGNDGDIWMSTEKGVSRYSNSTGTFRNYYFHHPSLNDNIINSIKGLTKDAAGKIWASSYGLWSIDPATDSIKGYWFTGGSKSLSDASSTHSVIFDKRNNGLWISTDEALNFFDFSSASFFHADYNPDRWNIFKLVDKRPLITIVDSLIWYYDNKDRCLYRSASFNLKDSFASVSFNDAISGFSTDGEGKPVFSFEYHPAVLYDWLQKKKLFLPPGDDINGNNFSGNVHDIFIDAKKNKWFCTADGLYIDRYNFSPVELFNIEDPSQQIPFSINSIAGTKNNLWFQNNKILYQFNCNTHTIKEWNIYKGKLSNILLCERDSFLWISSGKEIALLNYHSQKITRETALPNAYFAMPASGSIWVGTWQDGLYQLDNNGVILNHYSANNGMADKNLLCGWFDDKKSLWLGLNGGKGFTCFDLNERKFKNFLISAGNNSSMETNTITAVIGDKQDNLWLGTYGGGIYYFNRQQNRFYNYQQSDGLSSNYVNTLALDEAGNLWISTANAVDIMDVHSNTFRHVTEPVEQHNNDHIFNLVKSSDSRFYYAGQNKVIAIDPLKYTGSFPEATVLTTAFRIFDKEKPGLADQQAVTLPYSQNFFSVEFSVLKVSPDVPAQYRYKLEDFDKEWNNAENNGLANFTNVPPGNYRLLLNATNEAGEWNKKTLAIAITITPPFWQTWWFYIAVIFLTAAILFYFARNRLSHFKKNQQEKLRLIVATQEKEKRNIAAELHDDLGVRLSALKYFVSALQKYLSPQDEQVLQTYNKTIHTIDEAVEDIRYLLINLSPKTLNEYGYLVAVEDLLNKLAQLQIVRVTLHQQNMEARLPAEIESGLYRITQELINNTLKHAQANTIELSIVKNETNIELKYADNGKGFNLLSNSDGYGIENIQTRVSLLSGKIDWQSGASKGTIVNIIVPYNHT